jgi:hypothetical protein
MFGFFRRWKIFWILWCRWEAEGVGNRIRDIKSRIYTRSTSVLAMYLSYVGSVKKLGKPCGTPWK